MAPPWLLYDTSMALLHRNAMQRPWKCRGASVEAPRSVHGSAMETPWKYRRSFTEVLWAGHGGAMHVCTHVPWRLRKRAADVPWKCRQAMEVPWTLHKKLSWRRHKNSIETATTVQLKYHGGCMEEPRRYHGSAAGVAL